jgi:hypothetical protein
VSQGASPSAQFAALLSRFPPEIVALAKRCLPKLRRAFPGANQLVYDYSNSLVVAFGLSERGYEAIVALAIFPRWVRLYFDKSLPDPKGLLEGSGSKVRSVVVKAASDLDHGDIHALIKAAIKHSGAKFPRTGATRMVIKTESKKPPAKKTMTKPSAETLPLRIIVVDPPPGILWALQLEQDEIVQPTSATKSRIAFDFTVEVADGDAKGAFRLRGPAVQGRPGKRFVYLRMGTYAGQRDIDAGWRAKIDLEGITRKHLDAIKAKRASRLEVQFAGTGPKGGPACATVPLLGKGWQPA